MAERPQGYREVARDIASRIAAGEYPPGATLPSADAITRIYGVGMTTADRALSALRGAGLIDTQHGMLPKVRIQPERQGWWPQRGTKLIGRLPTFEERDELGIPEGVPVFEIYYRGEFQLRRADEIEINFE